MNPAITLQLCAERAPDAPALYLQTQIAATYGQWAARVAQLARGLREHCGVRPGDRLGIVLPNRPEYLDVLYAGWHAGLCMVPINSKLHPLEVQYIGERCEANAFAIDSYILRQWGALAGSIGRPLLDLDSSVFADLSRAPALPAHEPDPGEPAWIFFTSGTTGKPKGATLTYRNLLAMSLSCLADYGPVSPEDRLLHAAPLSHGSGLYALPFTMKGAAHVLMRGASFDPEEFVSLVNAHGCVSAFMAPTMITRLLGSQALQSLDACKIRQLIYGGAPMHLVDLHCALKVFGPRLAQLYGQGESPMTITYLSPQAHMIEGRPAPDEVLLSAGVARSGVEVRIQRMDGSRAAMGEIGEVAVRGDTVMAGYWNDPVATASALRDGWLRTGDLGAFDARGRLTLKGRSKEVIISGGSNIYPREVEDVLLEHPAIAEAAVLGMPDAEWGEIVVACVTAREGMKASAEELAEHCIARIARFKRPKRFVFCAELPKNGAGKIDKLALREAVR